MRFFLLLRRENKNSQRNLVNLKVYSTKFRRKSRIKTQTEKNDLGVSSSQWINHNFADFWPFFVGVLAAFSKWEKKLFNYLQRAAKSNRRHDQQSDLQLFLLLTGGMEKRLSDKLLFYWYTLRRRGKGKTWIAAAYTWAGRQQQKNKANLLLLLPLVHSTNIARKCESISAKSR